MVSYENCSMDSEPLEFGVLLCVCGGGVVSRQAFSAVQELTLLIRLTSTSEVCLSLPPEYWD